MKTISDAYVSMIFFFVNISFQFNSIFIWILLVQMIIWMILTCEKIISMWNIHFFIPDARFNANKLKKFIFIYDIYLIVIVVYFLQRKINNLNFKSNFCGTLTTIKKKFIFLIHSFKNRFWKLTRIRSERMLNFFLFKCTKYIS